MLKQANEQVGRAFAQVARWLGQAGQAVAPVARPGITCSIITFQ